MSEAEQRLGAALRIIEDYPNLHMGPTVSFVLGAVQRPIGAAPEDEAAGSDKLRHLLTTLQAAPSSRGVRIQWCGTVRAYVATSMPFVDGLVWDVQGCDSNDFEKLVDTLWRLYGSSIMVGDYSIDDLVWHPFTSDGSQDDRGPATWMRGIELGASALHSVTRPSNPPSATARFAETA